MIIDVKNTLNRPKNGSMSHLFPSRSLNFSFFAIVLMAPQCAISETIFSWQAGDGSITFSDRPPFEETNITIRKLTIPSIRGSQLVEDGHLDQAHPKTSTNNAFRDLPLACDPVPSTER